MLRFILILTFSILSLNLKAQKPLDSFFISGSEWCENEYHGAGMGTWWDLKYKFTISNDSNINGTNYHLLLCNNKLLGGVRADSESVYFVRLDTLGRGYNNIYTHGYSIDTLPANTELLLYDYNIQVGDTLAWKRGNKVVENIDSVQLINGVYAKRFLLGGAGTSVRKEYWVRGPGSDISLLGSYILPFGPGQSNARVYTGVAGAYQFGTAPYDCFPTNVPIAAYDETKLNFYPNPVADELYLASNKQMQAIVIYDMTGRVKIKIDIEQNEKTRTIKLPFESGVYFLNVQYANGTSDKHKLLKL